MNTLEELLQKVEVKKGRHYRSCAEDDPSYDYWDISYKGLPIGTVEETYRCYYISGPAYQSKLMDRAQPNLDDAINDTVVAFVIKQRHAIAVAQTILNKLELCLE